MQRHFLGAAIATICATTACSPPGLDPVAADYMRALSDVEAAGIERCVTLPEAQETSTCLQLEELAKQRLSHLLAVENFTATSIFADPNAQMKATMLCAPPGTDSMKLVADCVEERLLPKGN